MEAKGEEPTPIERKVYGRTGEIGKDGLLTPEQQALLNRIQEKAAKNALSYLDQMAENDPSPMDAMATGLGKGRIIHLMLERQIRKKADSRILVIAGTKLVLVKQTHQALEQYQQNGTNESSYIESEEDDELISETASIEANPLENQKSLLYKTGGLRHKDANVHIATIQTVQSALARGALNPDDYDLVIMDEVHNIGTAKRKATIDRFKTVVGFTATPRRHSGRMKAPLQYGFKVIESLPLPEAQELRFLPPLIGIQKDTKGLVDEIPMTQAGKIDFAKLEKLLKESPDLRPFIADEMAKMISDEGRRYKTVIAVNFVWEAQELSELLKAKGIKVGVAVNQQAAKEIHTEAIPSLGSIERYKLPEDDPESIQVLISPYVASEGFDAPATEVLVWASPTDSSLRYTQYTGRLARRNEGKRFGIIADFLYQTNQYNWNYNMGMWMKDDVVQLDNGLLYLGPETDIENLKRLPQVEEIRRRADVKPLAELQKEELLDVQETDFAVNRDNLIHTFVGSEKKLYPLARQVLDELMEKNPELVVKRKNKTRYVEVATDKQRFIDEMIRKGVTVKSSETTEVQETDIAVTIQGLSSIFIGNSKKIYPIAQQVLEEIRKENPELVVKRRHHGIIVHVVTDRQRFIQKMIKRGVAVKSSEIERVQQKDFAVTVSNLSSIFIGDVKKLSPIAKEVFEEIRQKNPELIVLRRSGNNYANAVTDRQRFIDEMVKRGIKLRGSEIRL